MFDITSFYLEIARFEGSIFSAEKLQLAQYEVDAIGNYLYAKGAIILDEESTQTMALDFINELRDGVSPLIEDHAEMPPIANNSEPIEATVENAGVLMNEQVDPEDFVEVSNETEETNPHMVFSPEAVEPAEELLPENQMVNGEFTINASAEVVNSPDDTKFAVDNADTTGVVGSVGTE